MSCAPHHQQMETIQSATTATAQSAVCLGTHSALRSGAANFSLLHRLRRARQTHATAERAVCGVRCVVCCSFAHSMISVEIVMVLSCCCVDCVGCSFSFDRVCSGERAWCRSRVSLRVPRLELRGPRALLQWRVLASLRTPSIIIIIINRVIADAFIFIFDGGLREQPNQSNHCCLKLELLVFDRFFVVFDFSLFFAVFRCVSSVFIGFRRFFLDS